MAPKQLRSGGGEKAKMKKSEKGGAPEEPKLPDPFSCYSFDVFAINSVIVLFVECFCSSKSFSYNGKGNLYW